MLSAVFAALAVQAVDPPSMASWSEIARELRATGMVSCGLTAQEEKLRARPINRPETPSPDWGFERSARHPGCVVLRFQIDASGRVIGASAVRQKGQWAGRLRERMVGQFQFSPGKSRRIAYLSVNVKVPPDQMTAVLEDLDRRIAEEQARPGLK